MDELKKIRKKLQEHAEEVFEADFDSDIPVHERFVNEHHVKMVKEKKALRKGIR